MDDIKVGYKRFTTDRYPSIPEILLMAGHQIVERDIIIKKLIKIIAEKDGIEGNSAQLIKHIYEIYRI